MNLAKLQVTRSTHKNKLCFTSNQQSKNKIKKDIILTIAYKGLKYLGINLAKKLKVLYNENYKTLVKKLKNT